VEAVNQYAWGTPAGAPSKNVIATRCEARFNSWARMVGDRALLRQRGGSRIHTDAHSDDNSLGV
jgi:hypothetical protein